jgi:CubicO group peptidase (beta-lactamase class C family)
MNIKKISIRIIMIVLLVASLTLTSLCTGKVTKPEDIALGDYTPVIDYVSKKLNKAVGDELIPSAVIALINEDEVIWQEAIGYADLESQSPATTDMVYRMGSISKTFTAMAIMQLAEKGLIDIDAPITQYLPDIQFKNEFAQPEDVSIRHIMAHRAGFVRDSTRTTEAMGSADRDVDRLSLEEIVEEMKDRQMSYPVGYRYKYSNIGITVLGRIIEVVTGQDYVSYMQQNVLTPIGMNDSAFLSNPDIKEKLVEGYLLKKGDFIKMSQYDISDIPAGNLYSTIEDMTDYVRFILREGMTTDGKQLIKAETLSSMFEDNYSDPKDPTKVGTCWHLYQFDSGDKVAMHNGGIAGFATYMHVMPERKLGAVLLTNGFSRYNGDELLTEALELMLEAKFGYKQQEFQDDIETPIELDPETMKKYEGRYSIGGLLTKVYLKKNKLKISMRGNEANLTPYNEFMFKMTHPLVDLGDMWVTFFVGDDAPQKDGFSQDILLLNGFTCPRVPKVEEFSPKVKELVEKEYEIYIDFSDELFAEMKMEIKDHTIIASLSNMKAQAPPFMIIHPKNDNEFMIVGGLNDREIIKYNNEEGYFYWAGLIIKPVSPETH